jgi:hypothetical protein
MVTGAPECEPATGPSRGASDAGTPEGEAAAPEAAAPEVRSDDLAPGAAGFLPSVAPPEHATQSEAVRPASANLILGPSEVLVRRTT